MAQRRYSPILALGLLLIIAPARTEAQANDIKKMHGWSSLESIGYPGVDRNYVAPDKEAVSRPLSPITTGIFEEDNVDMSLFGNFGNNILNSFRGRNLYYQLAAVAVTPVLVSGDVDYRVEHFFNQHPSYGDAANMVPYSGELLPFIAGGSLLAYAKIRNDDEVLGASFAVIQASVIELMDNIALKAITGRPGPNWRKYPNMDALSEEFRFGFLRGGIFNGWPSGHTGATMAVVSALTNYYPHSTWLKIAGYGLVAYTMYGVSSYDRGSMHWFSDAVAGALMAYTIGSTVGRYYRRVYSNLTGRSDSPSTSPLSFGITPAGIGFSYKF